MNIQRNYNIIEEEASKPVAVAFSEHYEAGGAWVRMSLSIPGGDSTEFDFDNPAQVEQLMWKIQEYLKNRNTFRRPFLDDDRAAEPVTDYK